MIQVHGTCIEIEGAAVLLRGGSGSGKSDLALRLIDGGARLVADDRVDLEARDGRLMASAPREIAGLFEARGIGVVRLEYAAEAPLVLIVDLVAPGEVERLPPETSESFLGVSLPLFRLAPFEASAAAKVRLAVSVAKGHIIPVP